MCIRDRARGKGGGGKGVSRRVELAVDVPVPTQEGPARHRAPAFPQLVEPLLHGGNSQQVAGSGALPHPFHPASRHEAV
eukprot:8555541-Lingulodinium_polyedra.AAC.1